MWKTIIDERLDCNQCTGDFMLPPPKFDVPPPPIPPEIQNLINCNQNDEFVQNHLDNWNLNNIRSYIKNFNATFLEPTKSSGQFSIILITLIAIFLLMLVAFIIIYQRFYRFKKLNKTNYSNQRQIKSLLKNPFKIFNKNKIQKENDNDNQFYGNNMNEYTTTIMKNYDLDYLPIKDMNKRNYLIEKENDENFLASDYELSNYFNEAAMMLLLQQQQQKQQQQQQQNERTENDSNYFYPKKLQKIFTESTLYNSTKSCNDMNLLNYNKFSNSNKYLIDRDNIINHYKSNDSYYDIDNDSITKSNTIISINDNNIEYMEINLIIPNLIMR